jgi:thioredoxin-related protein
MKNYLIGTLAVIIIFLLSVVYKQQNTMIFSKFPIDVQEKMSGQSSEVPLYLFLFFSKSNCSTCLDEVVKVLNGLTPPFFVLGVVPGNELEDEVEFRRITKAAFPLSSFAKYIKYVPSYTPTLIGVASSGKILFVLPGISMQSGYLRDFLMASYDNLYHVLKNEKETGNSSK